MLKRLKLFRNTLGYTQEEMASIMGIKRNTYSLIEHGERTLTNRHIESLADKAFLNKDWLLTGSGDMFREKPQEKKLVEIFESLSPDSQEYLIKLANIMLEEEKRSKD